MTVKFIKAPPIPEWMEKEYPFSRQVAVIDDTRVHFVDEGRGTPVLLMHGNPTWSFLWRKVIAQIVPHGIRAIAPDMIGLGLSDKPRKASEHSLEMHVSKILKLVEALDLKKVTIVGQDWGGPIVAAVAARAPERIQGVVFANTAVLLPHNPSRTTPFHQFSHIPVLSDFVFKAMNFPIPILHKIQGDPQSIGDFERRAYLYPLKKWKDRVAPLALARMVPNSPEHPTMRILEETDQWIRNFKGRSALVWGLRDPILGRALGRLKEALSNPPVTETQAGHFLQEEVPDEIAQAILKVTL